VRDVVVEHARGIGEHRTVPRQQEPQAVDDFSQLVEGAQVVSQVPVVGDDGRAAAEHRVAGEQRLIGGQQQAHRVAGMPRRRDYPKLTAGRAENVPVSKAFRTETEPVRGIGRTDRYSAAQLGEPGRALGVVGVPVRQHDHRHPPVARDSGI
jgi:hypothetical protein